MATNTLLTNDIILKEAMMHLDNNLVVSKLCNRDFESEFGGGVKAGQTIRLARPIYGTVRTGASMSAQDITEGRETLTVATQIGSDLEFTSPDLTLSVDKFSERILKPCMQAIAQNLDSAVYTELANKTYNWVGTPGQTINSYTDFALAPQRLDEMAVPAERVGILSPADYWGMAGSLTNIFSAGSSGAGGSALTKGKLSTIGNVDLYMSQNVSTHTNGTWSSVATIATVASTSTMSVTYLTAKDTWTQNLDLTGLTASTGTVAVGDVFTIANVFAVNPQGVTQSYLREFTVRTGGTASSTGTLTITISPPLITAAPYATVSAAAASNATITIKGSANTSYPQSMVFNPNAVTLAVVPMVKPQGAAWCEVRSYNGLSLRLVQGYDMVNDKPQWRFDLLYGVKAHQPWLATRISGTP